MINQFSQTRLKGFRFPRSIVSCESIRIAQCICHARLPFVRLVAFDKLGPHLYCLEGAVWLQGDERARIKLMYASHCYFSRGFHRMIKRFTTSIASRPAPSSRRTRWAMCGPVGHELHYRECVQKRFHEPFEP